MKNKIILVFTVFFNLLMFSQEKEFNFIINIDGKIEKNINEIILEVINNNEHKIYKLRYLPGKVFISENDYNNIKDDKKSKMYLKFKTSNICKNEMIDLNYEIDEFKNKWLNDYYFILYIYNMNINNNNKIYYNLPNKNYTYEYELLDNYSVKRIQKKFTKKQIKCNIN